jgi:hypothetical protein
MVGLARDFLSDVQRDEIQADLDRCRTGRSRCQAALVRSPDSAVLRLQLEAYDRWCLRYERELAALSLLKGAA